MRRAENMEYLQQRVLLKDSGCLKFMQYHDFAKIFDCIVSFDSCKTFFISLAKTGSFQVGNSSQDRRGAGIRGVLEAA
jgi:hypothetical protein